MNIKNWILVVGVLTTVVLVGLIGSEQVSNNRGLQQTHLEADGGQVQTTVNLTSEGRYEPEIATIKAGGAIKWVNNSNSPMWPASNPHPSHTGLGGFDPTRVIHPGDSWQFTFTSSGVYGYHDHLQPARRGTIKVEAQ